MPCRDRRLPSFRWRAWGLYRGERGGELPAALGDQGFVLRDLLSGRVLRFERAVLLFNSRDARTQTGHHLRRAARWCAR